MFAKQLRGRVTLHLNAAHASSACPSLKHDTDAPYRAHHTPHTRSLCSPATPETQTHPAHTQHAHEGGVCCSSVTPRHT